MTVMIISTTYKNQSISFDLSAGIDISTPLTSGAKSPKCFWAPDVSIQPVTTESFIGDIDQGGVVNFKNIMLNPHGNGTHTECVGHITTGDFTIHKTLKKFHAIARLTTVKPAIHNGDSVITEQSFEPGFFDENQEEILIVRTTPNAYNKLSTDYSGTNPTYFDHKVIEKINNSGVQHLITDLPSVDKEIDGGLLLAHKAFWYYEGILCPDKTITELVYVPNSVEDGIYFINMQIISLESDASPSKIVLYKPLDHNV